MSLFPFLSADSKHLRWSLSTLVSYASSIPHLAECMLCVVSPRFCEDPEFPCIRLSFKLKEAAEVKVPDTSIPNICNRSEDSKETSGKLDLR